MARRRRADRAGLGRCAVRASETDAAELASLSANKEGLAKHLAASQERSTVPVDLEASKSAVVDTTALPEGAVVAIARSPLASTLELPQRTRTPSTRGWPQRATRL